MEINRNNYQVWITDYYDGSLSDTRAAMLLRFLDLNPDLKDEFDSFGEIVLHPDISLRIDKDFLKKDPGKTDPEIIEHCAIALSENDLDNELKEQFLDTIEQSEYAKEEADLYQKLRLIPDNTIYPEKIKLKRIPFRPGFTRVALRVVSVAAAAAILVTLAIFLPRQGDNSFNYNSSYLLPFNTSRDLSQNEMLKSYTPVLATRVDLSERTTLEENIPVAATLNEEPERVIVAIGESPMLGDVFVAAPGLSPQLLAMSEADIVIEDYPDDKLSPRQFVAMNFRKHLLKEDEDNTGKIKVYEVADVSINGLSKLFGLEMQFEKEKTEDGRLASFKFTSQLLNLDHKMKNVTDDL